MKTITIKHSIWLVALCDELGCFSRRPAGSNNTGFVRGYCWVLATYRQLVEVPKITHCVVILWASIERPPFELTNSNLFSSCTHTDRGRLNVHVNGSCESEGWFKQREAQEKRRKTSLMATSVLRKLTICLPDTGSTYALTHGTSIHWNYCVVNTSWRWSTTHKKLKWDVKLKNYTSSAWILHCNIFFHYNRC